MCVQIVKMCVCSVVRVADTFYFGAVLHPTLQGNAWWCVVGEEDWAGGGVGVPAARGPQHPGTGRGQPRCHPTTALVVSHYAQHG